MGKVRSQAGYTLIEIGILRRGARHTRAASRPRSGDVPGTHDRADEDEFRAHEALYVRARDLGLRGA